MCLRGAIVPCGQRQSLFCLSFAGFAQAAFPQEMQLAQNLQKRQPVYLSNVGSEEKPRGDQEWRWGAVRELHEVREG